MPDQSERPDPTNVITAISRVMSELPAIGKDEKASSQQGGYAYRGIEAITKHAQGLFARYGVVFVPREVACEIKDIEVAGKPWTDTIIQIEYTVYGPGGVDDKITVGPLTAIGRDNSDKGSNKARTQAFKYALLQTLCISDAKDDGDQNSHERDRQNGGRQGAELTPDEQAQAWGWDDDAHRVASVEAMAERVHALPIEAQKELAEWRRRDGLSANKFGDYNAIVAKVMGYEAGDGAPFGEPAAAADSPPPSPAVDPASPLSLPPDTPAELVEQVVAEVKELRGPEIDEQLRERDAATNGSVNERRQRLTTLLIRERWKEMAAERAEAASESLDAARRRHDYGPDAAEEAERRDQDREAEEDTRFEMSFEGAGPPEYG